MRAARSRLQFLVGWRCPFAFALVLCIASFFAGRLSSTANKRVHQINHHHRASQLRLRANYRVLSDKESSVESDAVWRSISRVQRVLAGNATFEDALKVSGLTRMKPPIPPAASGDKDYTLAPFQVLSWYPRAVFFPKFIDERTCETFKDIASKRLAPSGLALRAGEKYDAKQNVRTSSGTFVMSAEDHSGLLRNAEEKAARVTMLPTSHGEAFNVLRYYLGQHYDSHYDVFNPKDYGPQRTQRAATLLFYLTTPEQGGETIFKLEGKDKTQVWDYAKCDVGLKFKPRTGDVLLFWSLTPNGSFDNHALHGGCPVEKGVKWAATKWVHDKPMGGFGI